MTPAEATQQRFVATMRLLFAEGVDLNLQDNKGDTPLHFAIKRGDALQARILAAIGADTRIRNGEGKSGEDLMSMLPPMDSSSSAYSISRAIRPFDQRPANNTVKMKHSMS